ncbi:MAG: hypothetical protein RMK01_09545 [Thermomicrobium sp.]|nr:hypothetical protein [Thermomicrobium sp.]MDW8060304.1 hypothetical protein [Thermomicrobium sp.]
MLWRRQPKPPTPCLPSPAEGALGDRVGLPLAFGSPLIRGLVGTVLRSASERVFLLRGQPRAYAHVVAEPGRDHWFLARLVTPADEPDAGVALLEAIAREAGARGVIRLHTLVPDRPEWLEWWQRAGFSPFRRVLLLSAVGDAWNAAADLPVRVQDSVDTWEVQRLYERLTPRPVQYAEARNRATWQTGRRAGWRVRGFLLADESGLAAYCRVRSRRGRHLVELLVDGQAGETAVRFVQAALARCARSGDEALVLLPEEYALLPAFERAGFQLLEARVWVARYTVRRMRAWRTEETARLAALADAPRVLYRRERPKVATAEPVERL